MTVPSGRATSGARSVLRAVFCGVFAIVGLIAGGCGSSTFTYGTVIVTVSADPGPFTAYVADIASISFLQGDNTSGYGFSNSTGFGKTVDFAKLSDTTEVFGAPAVLEGTYTQISITVNYGSGANSLASQIYVDVNGQPQAATIVDSTGATPSTVTYTVKLDPAQPLIVKNSTPVKLDLHFDMSASTIINAATSPITATVRPFLTASTQPVINKALRTRGEFVTVDTAGSNFTMNSVAFFDSPSYTNAPQGAIQVQTTAQTTFNVNGVPYQGANGLAALSGLPINTIVLAYGSLGNISQLKPILNATEVYAGVATENVLATRVTGTVSSRTATTLNIHNAEINATNNIVAGVYGISTPSGVLVRFAGDVGVTVSAATLVEVDRQPTVPSSLQLISVGQQVEIQGVLSVDSAGNSSVDASGGLVRLNPTTAWGNLKSATAGNATVGLLSLGGVEPAALTFAGTGSATGADSDPTAYKINTGTVDLTGADTTVPWRFDGGTVAPFGTAGPASPDFTATGVTAGTSTDQVLEIEWAGSGTVGPFTSVSSSGLVVNIDNPGLGTTHVVRTGPAVFDLKNAEVSPTIVADTTLTGQFAIGNPASTTTTTISVFQTFAAYLTQLSAVLNGTNTVLKVVAVGHWDLATKTFTAYRIDIVQLP
jgi:hypothetical protein